MTLHRIHHDTNFLLFEIPTREVLSKLGREHPFHIDRSPISYASIWTPLTINFVAVEKGAKAIMPDLCARNGRMFFNNEAYNLLRSLLAKDGEFLPVVYNDAEGYIFNPLVVAENIGMLDQSLIHDDPHGNLDHFSFLEKKIGGTVIFRAKVDDYCGMFCTDKLKSTIEQANLTGIYFQNDLANFSGKT